MENDDEGINEHHKDHDEEIQNIEDSPEFEECLELENEDEIQLTISKILGVFILLNNILFGSLRNFEYCSSLTNDFPFFLPKYLFFDSNI